MANLLRDHLIIRRARPDDVDALVEFSAAMARETEGRTLNKERLRRGTVAVFESPARGFYLVAELPNAPAGGLAGQLLITYEWSDWRNASFWWIQSVYVHPAWRGQGVYRRLHECIVREARACKEVCGIRLYVERENRTAQSAYGRVGLVQAAYLMFEEDFILGRRDGGSKEEQCNGRG